MAILDYPRGSGPLCDRQDKKKWIIGGIAGVIALIILIIIICATKDSGPVKGSSVLDSVPLVDGYNNLADLLRQCSQNDLNKINFTDNLVNTTWDQNNCKTFTDLSRLKQGKVFSQIWFASAPCNSSYKDALSIILEQIDVLKRLIDKYPDQMQLVTSLSDLNDAYGNKKIASFIGVSGGHALDSKLATLRMLYQLGVRVLALSPNCSTPWLNKENGLTDFGKVMILEANRLGMILDLNGLYNETLASNVIDTSLAPVIYSHEVSAIVLTSPKNIPDKIIQKINFKKGLIMMTFNNELFGGKGTFTSFADELNHIVGLSSFDTVALGSGFGLYEKAIDGMVDVSTYPDLFDFLYTYEDPKNNKKFSLDNLKKLASENFQNILEMVEKISIQQQKNTIPNVQWIPTNYLAQDNSTRSLLCVCSSQLSNEECLGFDNTTVTTTTSTSTSPTTEKTTPISTTTIATTPTTTNAASIN